MADEVKRLKYFLGQFLEEKDFQDEQAYHMEMRRRLNQAQRTPGIVYGLHVKVTPSTDLSDPNITVGLGLAIDNQGRELVIVEPIVQEFKQDDLNSNQGKVLRIYLTYSEIETYPTTSNITSIPTKTRYSEVPILKYTILNIIERRRPPDDWILLEMLQIVSNGKLEQLKNSNRQMSDFYVHGNVGIGVPDPDAKLHVNDSKKSQGYIKFFPQAEGADFGYNGGDDGGFWFTNYGIKTGETRFRWSYESENKNLLVLKNNGDISWANNSWLNTDHGGSIVLGGDRLTKGTGTPYIDFHFKDISEDYNTRIINDGNRQLTITAPDMPLVDTPTAALRIIKNAGSSTQSLVLYNPNTAWGAETLIKAYSDEAAPEEPAVAFGYYRGDCTPGKAGHGFIIKSGNKNDGYTPKLLVTDTGKVGIGTGVDEPQQALHVRGDVYVEGNVYSINRVGYKEGDIQSTFSENVPPDYELFFPSKYLIPDISNLTIFSPFEASFLISLSIGTIQGDTYFSNIYFYVSIDKKESITIGEVSSSLPATTFNYITNILTKGSHSLEFYWGIGSPTINARGRTLTYKYEGLKQVIVKLLT